MHSQQIQQGAISCLTDEFIPQKNIFNLQVFRKVSLSERKKVEYCGQLIGHADSDAPWKLLHHLHIQSRNATG